MKLKKVRNKRLLLRLLNRQMQSRHRDSQQNQSTPLQAPKSMIEPINKPDAVNLDNDEPPGRRAA